MSDTLLSIAKSWCETEGEVHTTAEILDWIKARNEHTYVSIRPISLGECEPWHYDEAEGCICNKERSFFTISGCRMTDGQGNTVDQPIIRQEEIGFLGIICRQIGGVMHFLMQAKIEPGNVNCIQVSPTIQATKSNFTQKHGGRKPAYLDYFVNAGRYEIVVDQIQSEQSSRFYKKRNRNIIIRVEEDIPVLPSHCWMTLGQIKALMRQDNLVNMDTRTVLSCLPFVKMYLSGDSAAELMERFHDKELFRSAFVERGENPLPAVYQYINNKKMFSVSEPEFIPLREMRDWQMRDGELVCSHPYPFRVIFCDIAIEGREVRRWTQPLIAANGSATMGLICCEDGGVLKFLVRAAAEVGCFDGVELGPTVQRECVDAGNGCGPVEAYFLDKLRAGEGVMFDHMLSEEGGRFYHEQNRNVLLRVRRDELPALPAGYFLLDHRTLNELVQVNNTLNIQLRNLLALLEA